MASTYPLEVVQADRWCESRQQEAQGRPAHNRPRTSRIGTRASRRSCHDAERSHHDERSARLDSTISATPCWRSRPTSWMRSSGCGPRRKTNGKLATTKQQTVSVAQQEPDSRTPIIVIEPASPETVYVPYYEPASRLRHVALSRLSALLLSRRRRARSWAEPSRAALPGARPLPSAMRSGTIIDYFNWATATSMSISTGTSNIDRNIDINRRQVGAQFLSPARRELRQQRGQEQIRQSRYAPSDRKLDYQRT